MNETTLRFDGLAGFARFEHAAMATTFVFHLRGSDDERAWLASAAAEAGRLIDQLEEQLSFYRESSEVSRINRAAPGDTLRVGEATLSCLLVALEVAAASGSAFDPFAGAAALSAKGQPIPSHLVGLLADDTAGSACLEVDPASATVRKLSGRRWLDLGAVGKGYALDAAAALLQEWGIEAGLLVAGGSSVVGFGPGPSEGGTWKLHLGGHAGQRELPLSPPFALGASGEGFQPGHLIRPSPPGNAAASSPARSQMAQRTFVLAPTGALADALATALFVIAPDDRAALMKAWPEAAMLVEPTPDSTATRAAGATVNTPMPEASGAFRALAAPARVTGAMVVPSWKESKRLPRFLPALCALVTEQQLPVQLFVVDDGSPAAEADATAALVDQVRSNFPCLQPLVRLIPHEGKGGAILHGWDVAGATSDWLGFVDADGAVPAEEVVKMWIHALSHPPEKRLLAANRLHRDPRWRVERPFFRSLLGDLLARWSRRRLHHGARDPQCGCKIVAASLVRGRRFGERGYGLDLELLLIARTAGGKVEDVPIAWHEVAGSHLRAKDLWDLLKTIERLRRRLRLRSD